MKRWKKILALMLSAVCVASSATFFPSSAVTDPGDSEARYTQKIVTVVYDNSGSMAGSEARIPPAKYALSMLISLLDERDEMYIIPMNNGPASGITVDLASTDRNGVLDQIVNETVLNRADGGTPSDSMKRAVSVLNSRGLKNSANLIDSDPSKEYWMVVLTDGLFDSGDPDPSYQASRITNVINDYPTLHTVYVSFGSDAEDISGVADLKKFPFTSYCKVPASLDSGNGTSDNLVTVIQKIANQISGRYSLKNDQYKVDGNTLTLDLSTIPFSLSALSVIAQNCGATVTDADYEDGEGNRNTKVSLSKVCTIKPDAQLKIKNGCAFEVSGDKYLYGGKLVLTFDAPVTIDQLSIFAEPALDISSYYEAEVDGAWKRVDMPYINANLGDGDAIRVGYEVKDQVNGNPLDLNTVFGSVQEKVTYCKETFSMGSEIPLKTGTNELMVEVSVMNGTFTLRKSEIITIEKDPSYFRIESSGDTEIQKPSATAIFTVFVNNQPATQSVLQDYVCTATVCKKSDGTILSEKKVSPDSDGKIRVSVDVKQNDFDVYSITLEAVSPQKTSRTATHDITYVPSSLDLAVNGNDHLTLTQYALRDNKETIQFALTTGGQPYPFENSFAEFKLTVEGKDVTQFAEVSGNLLIYTPSEESLGGGVVPTGEREILLTLTSSSYPSLNTSANAKLTVEETVFTVVPLSGTVKDIDRFDLKNCTASLAFSIQHDGIPFTAEELTKMWADGQIQAENTPLFDFFLFPATLTQTVEEIDGTPAIVLHAERDMGDYLDWHLSAFITGGAKDVTVTYAGATATDNFQVVDSSIFQHILRITLLVLVIAWLIHLIPWLIGCFVVKSIPPGYVVDIYSLGSKISNDVTEINVSMPKRILLFLAWQAVRLIVPGFEFMDQPLWGQDPGLANFEIKFKRQNGLYFVPDESETFYRVKAQGINAIGVSNFEHDLRENGEANLADYVDQPLSDVFGQGDLLSEDTEYGISGIYSAKYSSSIFDGIPHPTAIAIFISL